MVWIIWSNQQVLPLVPGQLAVEDQTPVVVVARLVAPKGSLHYPCSQTLLDSGACTPCHMTLTGCHLTLLWANQLTSMHRGEVRKHDAMVCMTFDTVQHTEMKGAFVQH